MRRNNKPQKQQPEDKYTFIMPRPSNLTHYPTQLDFYIEHQGVSGPHEHHVDGKPKVPALAFEDGCVLRFGTSESETVYSWTPLTEPR